MHYYERNIADIKEEYTTFLIHIISPLIYEGIKSMYLKALEQEASYIQMSKDNVNVKNPGVLKIFQHFLKNITSLNQNLIEAEMIRIRDSSKHADIFEKLIKAVVKSHIVLLTYNSSGQQCKIVNEKLHEKIDSKMFIHKIYIETARQVYDVPELFWHLGTTLETKKNQRECINIINQSISIAIKESIPMSDIITEYLKNDYIVENEADKFDKIKSMLNNDDNINYFDDDDKKVLMSNNDNNRLIVTEDNNINNNIQNNINDIEQLINNNDNNNINNNVTSYDDNDYQEKLNNFNSNLYNKGKNNNKVNLTNNNNNNNQVNLANNDNQDNLENNDNNNNQVNLANNNDKLDDKNYFNALFN